MDSRKTNAFEGGQGNFARAMHDLAQSLREAGECLLDLQEAVEALQLLQDGALSRTVDRETAECLRQAMRGPGSAYQRR